MVQIVLRDRRASMRVSQQPPPTRFSGVASAPASPARDGKRPPMAKAAAVDELPSTAKSSASASPPRDGKPPPKAVAVDQPPPPGVSSASPSPAGDGNWLPKVKAAAVDQAPPTCESGRKEMKKADSFSRVKRPIFKGYRFILLGVTDTAEFHEDITSRAGEILPASQFENCTHICIQGHADGIKISGPKVVSKSWISNCCRENTLAGVVVDCLSELCKRHHQVFLCPLDQSSDLINITDAIKRCESKTQLMITPGSLQHHGHESLVTDDWMKLLVKKCYLLLRRLQLAGLSLNGNFSAFNFIVDEALGELTVKFGFLPEKAVTKATPEGKQLDVDQFIKMVRYTLFGECIPGHELNLWLDMLNDEKLEELMLESVLVMDLKGYSEKFMALYDALLNASSTDQDFVLAELSAYNGWQKLIESAHGNQHLQTAFYRVEKGKSGKERYADTAVDLLRLLRNCRQHNALPYSALFALVVGHHFPNLISDLQRALFLASKN